MSAKKSKSGNIQKAAASKVVGGHKYPPGLWAVVLFSLAAALLLLAFTTRNYYLLTALCCLYTAALVWLRRGLLKVRCTLPVIVLSFYLLLVGLSGLWAVAPNLFIEEYAKLLLAFSVFLSVLLLPGDRARAVAVTLWLSAGTAGAIALLSLEAATSGLLRDFTYMYLNAPGLQMGFEEGTRLIGMLGSPNIFAGILGIGVLASVSLADTAPDAFRRGAAMGLLALNAYAFLLAFSLGALVFFALSVLVYLIAAGPRRLAALRMMLMGAVPALLCAGLAFPCFGTAFGLIPLLLAPVCAGLALLAERFLFTRADRLEKKAALILGGAAGVLALYLAAAFTLTGGYAFGGAQTLSRSAYLSQGDYALEVRADAAVSVTVRSQNRLELLSHTHTVLYEGDAGQASFNVPGDSLVCFFDFSGAGGTVLDAARLSNGRALKLGYPLLPGFAANRLQGLFANQNAVQRLAFFEDGLKIFRLRPLLGGGPGCYEREVFAVQDFYYATRYVHNHFIQVLADNGLLGFLLNAGFLALLLIRLLRRSLGRPLPIFAGLLSCMVMIWGHALMEACFSFAAYLPFAFGIFALISWPAEEAQRAPARAEPALRWGLSLLGSVYAVLFVLCLIAAGLAKGGVQTSARYLKNQKTAAALDPFNRPTYQLAYIDVAAGSGLPEAVAQASDYIEAMSENAASLPVVKFCLIEGRFEQAMSMAERFVLRKPLDEKTWTGLFGLFEEYFNAFGTLYKDKEPPTKAQVASLKAEILALHERLEPINAGQIRQISLGEALEDFIKQLS